MRKSYGPSANTLSPSLKNSQSYASRLSSSKGFTNVASPKGKTETLSPKGLGYTNKSATESYKSSFVSTADKNENAGHERRASENSDLVKNSLNLKTSLNSPKYSQAVKLMEAQRSSTDKKFQPSESLQKPVNSPSPASGKIQRPGTGSKPLKKELEINTEVAPSRYSNNYKALTTKNQDNPEKSSSSPDNKASMTRTQFDFTPKPNSSSNLFFKKTNTMTQSLQLTQSGSYSRIATANRESSDRMTPTTSSRTQNGTTSRLFKPTYDKMSYSQRSKLKDQSASKEETPSRSGLKFDFNKPPGSRGKSQAKAEEDANIMTKSTKFDSGVETEEGTIETEPNYDTLDSKRVLNTTGSMDFTNKGLSNSQVKKQAQKPLRSSSTTNTYAFKYTNPASTNNSSNNYRQGDHSGKETPKNPENTNNGQSDGVSLQSFVTKVNKGKVQQQQQQKGKQISLTLEDSAASGGATRGYSSKQTPKTTTADLHKNGKDLKAGTYLTTSTATTTMTTTSEDLAISKNSSKNVKGLNGKEDSALKASPFIYYVTSLEKHHRFPDENNYFCQLFREHFLQTYQAMQFCKYMKPADPKQLQSKKVFLAKRDTHKDKKTLVFDLDETLIHCNESNDMSCDVKLPITFPHGEVIEAGINVRPYAIEALRELSPYFEIIVFTASHGCYANVVLDYLDPTGQYIHHRLFRDNCIQTEEGIYIKDLRVIANRNLIDLILVDNAAYSFGFQIENGIPIAPFYNNYDDKELKHLVPYLKFLAGVKDQREINRQTFKLHMYTLYDNPEKVIEKVILNK